MYFDITLSIHFSAVISVSIRLVVFLKFSSGIASFFLCAIFTNLVSYAFSPLSKFT